MRWIRTGRQIGQAVKNVQRLRQITNVFAKHGFADVLHRMGLGKLLPSRFGFEKYQETQTIPQRLRAAFEELGPTFVKLGQLLSTRPDIVPDNIVEEMRKLQDRVAPVPISEIRKTIEKELRMPVEKAFADFNPEPLASASIAQVHEATLKTGERVVLKIQRPGIDRSIRSDVSILETLAGMLERYVPETRILSPSLIVEEFFKTLSFELDFLVEANNMIRFSENMKEFPEIVVPQVFKKFTTGRILTMEKLEGIPVNNLEALDKAGVDKREVVQSGARAFFKSIMIDGLFHGDLHGGNIFVLPGNKLGIIDFGIVGRLSQNARDQLINIVLALINEDFENLCHQYVELGPSDPGIDFDGFQREVRNTLSPYLGLNISEVDSGKILIDSTKIAAKYNIRVSGDWMVVFKAILTIEGMGRDLDPEFNFLALGEELVRELVKSQYSMKRITNELIWISKDVSSLLRVLPRNLKWMIRKVKSNNFALEVQSKELSSIKNQLETSSRRTSTSIIIAGLFIASSIALQYSSGMEFFGYPVLAVAYLILALVFLFRIFLI